MMMSISEIIGIAGFVLALVSFIWNILNNRKLKRLDLQLKEAELEKAKKSKEDTLKADIEVNHIETIKGKKDKLKFYNKGMAVATNVRVDFPSDEDNKIGLSISKDYLPYPKLLPQQAFDIPYSYYGTKPHQTIVMTWDDAFGKDRVKEMIIDL